MANSNNIDAWLEEYGQMPFVQVLMPPAVVKLIDGLLAGVNIELHPTDLGEGELPALTALPNKGLLRRLMAVDPGPTEPSEKSSDAGDGGRGALEDLTGFRRHPVTELPPECWLD